MIISHRHKFIFLKTRKTASTSIEIALSKYCGPRDIITPVGEEQLREVLDYRKAQNYTIPIRAWKPLDLMKFVRKRRAPRYDKHMSAERAKKRLNKDVWQEYFKFCVERNPYDKAISLYYWRTRTSTERPELLDFLQSVDEESLSNFHIYGIDGKVSVDRVIRYEKLTEELGVVSAQLGLGPLDLPRAKGGIRIETRSYRELMTNKERSIVERLCKREIKLLGYEF